MYLSGCGLPGPDIETGVKLVTSARALGNLSTRASLTSHDLLPHIGEDGRKLLATTLRDRGASATPVRADVTTLREPLETVNALGLYSVVPQKFKCH